MAPSGQPASLVRRLLQRASSRRVSSSTPSSTTSDERVCGEVGRQWRSNSAVTSAHYTLVPAPIPAGCGPSTERRVGRRKLGRQWRSHFAVGSSARSIREHGALHQCQRRLAAVLPMVQADGGQLIRGSGAHLTSSAVATSGHTLWGTQATAYPTPPHQQKASRGCPVRP